MKWRRRLEAWPPLANMAVAVVGVALVALADYTSGPEVSFSIFYLLPVMYASWLISLRAGVGVALLSASVWGYLDIATNPTYTAAWIPYWNSAVRLGFFLMVSWLLDRLRIARDKERALARTDGLTGIANTRVFVENTQRVIAESQRSGTPFTLAYIDLDRFKSVNDQFGHSEGDRLLKHVADTLVSSLRTTDLAARLGGDEFGVLMPGADFSAASLALRRTQAAFEDTVNSQWPVGATFGAITFVSPPDSVDTALRLADELMYSGKEEGRGRIMQASWPAEIADPPTAT